MMRKVYPFNSSPGCDGRSINGAQDKSVTLRPAYPDSITVVPPVTPVTNCFATWVKTHGTELRDDGVVREGAATQFFADDKLYKLDEKGNEAREALA